MATQSKGVFYYSDSINSTVFYPTRTKNRRGPHLQIILDKTKKLSAILTKGNQSCVITKEWIQGVAERVTPETLPIFLKGTYVLLSSTIGGGHVIRIQRRLPGGDPYSEKRRMIEEHIRLIVNPYVLVIIKDVLNSYTDGLAGLVLHESLPQDTRDCLTAFSNAMIEKYNSQGYSLECLAQIGNDLNELIAAIPEVKKPWKELDFFYRLPAVKKLLNKDLQILWKMIERDEDIEVEVIKMLSDYVQGFNCKDFDKEVIALWKEENPNNSTKYNLGTLTSQIKIKNPRDESFKDMITKGAFYFLDKQIIIQESQLGQGKIVEAYFEDEKGNKSKEWNAFLQQTLVLLLDLQSLGQPVKIRITPDWTVQSIATIANYGLLEAIQGDLIKDYERCSILDQWNQLDFSKVTYVKKILKDKYEVIFCDKEQKATHVLHVTHKIFGASNNEKVTLSLSGGTLISEEGDFHAFNQRFRLCKTKETIEEGINSQTIDQKIQLIAPRIDENQIYRETYLLIDQLFKELRDLIGKNPELLSSLITSFVDSGLKRVNIALVTDKVIKDKLRKTSDLFTAKMNDPKTQEDILVKVVQEVNYSRFVKIENGVFLASLMELLKEADHHLENIKNKDGILFMGYTGSGKSTLVCDLLDVELERDINAVGEQVWKVSPEVIGAPKIGQSLGTSETLYAQGFPYKAEGKPEVHIVDMPGLGETRGLQYEVCSYISVDQTIENMRDIKGIVLVVPMEIFLSDRANRLILFMKEIGSRFPQIFTKGSETRTCIHIAVTKISHHKLQAKMLENGSLVKELLNGVNEEINRQKAQIGQGVDSEVLLSGLLFQQQVWELLNEMHNNLRLRVTKINENVIKQELREAYYGGNGSVDKTQYCPAMEREDLQKQFANSLTHFARAWREQILENYVKLLPKKIKVNEDKIAVMIEELNKWDDAQTTSTAREKNHKDFGSNAKNSDVALKIIEGGMPRFMDSRNLAKQQLDKVKASCQERCDEIEEDIKQNQRKIIQVKEAIVLLNQRKHEKAEKVIECRDLNITFNWVESDDQSFVDKCLSKLIGQECGHYDLQVQEVKTHVSYLDYNQAELRNEINACNGMIDKLHEDIERLQGEMSTNRADLANATQNILNHDKETQRLIAMHKQVELEQMLKNCHDEIAKLKMEKRDLAIVIKTKIDTARHLVKLAKKILRNKDLPNQGAALVLNASSVSDNVFEECRNFLQFCTEEFLTEVLQECDKDLI